MSYKILAIISGVPGTGKSTQAKMLQKKLENLGTKAEIFEADAFCMVDGKYCWKPGNVKANHEKCQAQARAAMDAGEAVIISNTSLTPMERKPYFDMAIEHGYEVYYCHLSKIFGNIHGINAGIVQKMEAKYQPLTAWEKDHAFRIIEG